MSGLDITAFRQKYPQYDSIDDATLADRLYTKHYAGKIERADFDAKFLGAPEPKQNWLQRTGSAIAEAWKGDAEYPELGSMSDSGRKSLKGGAALAFGGDEDAAKAWAADHPDLVLSEDANGNALFRDQAGEPVGYVNKPGADGEDVARLGTKIASFIPAGRAASAAGNVAARGASIGGWTASRTAAAMAAGGAASAATDATMQKASGREEIDGAQVAMTGALGAGAEGLAPVLGRVGKAIWNRLKGGDESRIMALGQESARRQGLDLSDEQIMTLGRLEAYSGDLVDSEVKASAAEFGMPYRRSQMMPTDTQAQRLARHRQASYEEALFQGDDMASQRLRDTADVQVDRTKDLVDELNAEMGGPTARPGKTPQEAASEVQGGLQVKRAADKDAYRDAYGVAETRSADLADDAVLEIPDRIKARLRRENVTIHERLTPAALTALEQVDNFAASSIKDLNTQRQVLDQLIKPSMNGLDRRAATIIRDEYVKSIDDAVDARLFSGDPDAWKELKNANRLFAQFQRRYNSPEKVGKMVQELADPETQAERAAQVIAGMSSITNTSAATLAKRIGEAVGRDSDTWDALRQAVFLRVTKDARGEPKSQKALTNALRTALDGNGASAMKELFSSAERAKMRRWIAAVERTIPDKGFERTAGTAERILRYGQNIFGGTPLLHLVPKALESYGKRAAMKAPTLPGPKAPALPVGVGGAASVRD